MTARPRRWGRAASYGVALVTAAILAACSRTDADRPGSRQQTQPDPTSASSVLPSSPTDPSEPPTTPRSATTLTLAFAGDLNFDQQLATLLPPDARLVRALRPLLGGADLSMLNLETSLTARGAPEPKTYHFRAPPSALDAVAATGVDVVTMANNHAADYGPVGLADSLAAVADSPIPVVGIGAQARQAFAPAVLHRAGLSIAVFGATQIDDRTLQAFSATATAPGVATSLDPARLVTAVRAARRAHDLVIVYLHWGLDYTSCPDDRQPAVAAALSAAGADVIVGSHAHRVQGGGWLGRSYVDYGLGNFVWARNDDDNGVSGVLTLTVDVPAVRARASSGESDGPVVVGQHWTPLLIGDDGLPRRPEQATSADLTGRWERARACADLGDAPR